MGEPVGAMKSMPSCIAWRPLKGSMRQPKPEALYATLTGWMVGIILSRNFESINSVSMTLR